MLLEKLWKWSNEKKNRLELSLSCLSGDLILWLGSAV